jgi:hypothetical protein
MTTRIEVHERGRDIADPVSRSSSRAGTAAVVATATGWLVVLGKMASNRIYVSHDSIISYAHAWYVSDAVWHRHRVPLRMPVVGHGAGFAYPYGLVPWTVAALLRPVFGDWSTTIVLVAATIGLIAATFWAFPELRRGWWAAALLIEPALISSPIIGQVPFVSAAAVLMVAVGAWRRQRTGLAIVTAGLAQATHPAIVVPLALAIVAGRLRWEPRRRALAVGYALSLLFAVPGIIILFASPVVEETSTGTKIVGFVETLGPRCLVIAVPVGLVLLRRRGRPALGPAAVAFLVAMNIAMWSPLGMSWAVAALDRSADTRMVAFTDSPAFRPGATYRVLRVADGKIGMYQLLLRGGRLDSEFFPESIARHSWPNLDGYTAFLHGRHVDYVMVWRGYDREFRTNEHYLLDALTRRACTPGDTQASLVWRVHDYDLYEIHPCRPQPVTSSG